MSRRRYAAARGPAPGRSAAVNLRADRLTRSSNLPSMKPMTGHVWNGLRLLAVTLLLTGCAVLPRAKPGTTQSAMRLMAATADLAAAGASRLPAE